jgi:hypothetical protein
VVTRFNGGLGAATLVGLAIMLAGVGCAAWWPRLRRNLRSSSDQPDQQLPGAGPPAGSHATALYGAPSPRYYPPQPMYGVPPPGWGPTSANHTTRNVLIGVGGGCFVLVVLLIAVVVTSSSFQQGLRQGWNANATATPFPTPPPAVDVQLLKAANINQQQLPAGWTQCCDESVLTSTELHASRCVDLSTETAGFSREFAFDLVAGASREHLQSIVRSTATTQQTAAILAETASAAEDSCVMSAIGSDVPNDVPAGAILETPSITRIDRHLPLPGHTRLYSVFYTVNGTGNVFYTDWINMSFGRLRVTLRISGRVPALNALAAWEQAVIACHEPELIATAARLLAAAQ